MKTSEYVDKELVLKTLKQLNEVLTEAYYSTPHHISSKMLIKRALDLARSIESSLESGHP